MLPEIATCVTPFWDWTPQAINERRERKKRQGEVRKTLGLHAGQPTNQRRPFRPILDKNVVTKRESERYRSWNHQSPPLHRNERQPVDVASLSWYCTALAT
jgi:hypothetical protein